MSNDRYGTPQKKKKGRRTMENTRPLKKNEKKKEEKMRPIILRREK